MNENPDSLTRKAFLAQAAAEREHLADAVLAVLPASPDQADAANLRTMYDAVSARENELIEERDELIRQRDQIAMDTMKAITAEPTDRGAVLREAADEIEARQARLDAEELDEIGSLDHETVLQGAAVRDMATHLRRVADETPQPSVHDYTGAPTP